MGPSPTRAYFWPTFDPGTFWPDPKGKKLKNLTFLGKIFQIQTQIINGWPNPTQATKI